MFYIIEAYDLFDDDQQTNGDFSGEWTVIACSRTLLGLREIWRTLHWRGYDDEVSIRIQRFDG